MAAKKRHDAKEAQQEEERQLHSRLRRRARQAAEPAPSGGLTPDAMERLKRLGELHERTCFGRGVRAREGEAAGPA